MTQIINLDQLRELDRSFCSDDWPQISCPVCTSGSLTSRKIRIKELGTHYSSFSASLLCGSCSNCVMAYGEIRREDRDGKPAGVWTGTNMILKVSHLEPSLPLMNFPKNCPQTIRNPIHIAAQVILLSPDLAANRIRVAVENLLTTKGVVRFVTSSKGKRVRLSTHDRIVRFRAKNRQAAKFLEAAKWIGNPGSHESGLTINEVINGIELFDQAIGLLYGNRQDELDKLAGEIIAHKGPKKPSRKLPKRLDLSVWEER